MFTLGKKCKIIVVKSLQLWRINWRWRLFMVLLVADQVFATVSVHKCFVLGENNTCLLKNKVNLQSWTKVLGTVMQYSYFSCHSGSLVKQCILFEIFLQFSLPYPIQRKNSGYTRQTLFVGWGKGTLGLCELENAQKCKSVPKLLSMIVVHLIFICFELLVNHILTFSFSFSYYPP